jgi:selenocysteine lyase/cysteine desulfurase
MWSVAMTGIDIEAVRAETPGCESVIHLNSCGAGLMPAPVLSALHEHLDLEARIGGYEAEDRARPAIERTYDALAEMLNCRREEIALVENATVGWCMAFYGLPFAPGDRILTAQSEYASNYIAYLQRQKRDGVEISVVPNDDHGQLDVAALSEMIDDRVKLISVTHVPTNGGLINPVAEIGRVAQDAGVPFLVDACQSAGQLPLDVEAIGCDMLTATGRKYLRGPRGTGFLYVRSSILDKLEPPFLDLRAAEWTAPDTYRMLPDARRFENWENYVAGQIGLGAAVDYAASLGIETIAQRVQTLADQLRTMLAAIDGITVRDLGLNKSGIVSFDMAGVASSYIVEVLRDQGINIHKSSVSSTRHDMEARGLSELNRVGVHYYNTEDELDRLVTALTAIRGNG